MSAAINIERELEKLASKLLDLDKKEQRIIQQKNHILVQFHALNSALEKLGKKVSFGIPATHSQLELFFGLNENTKLGDAIETILRVKGPISRKEIIDLLRQYRVRISLKASQQVLANTIKKDKKQRFVILEDGRVALNVKRKGRREQLGEF